MCNKHLDIKKLQLLAWKKLRKNGEGREPKREHGACKRRFSSKKYKMTKTNSK